jgi:hypothetical protein
MTLETSVSALLCFKGGLKWRYRGSRFGWTLDLTAGNSVSAEAVKVF